MDNIVEDALNLTRLVPWIHFKDLKSYLRKIPLKKSNYRCQLALQHFFRVQDLNNTSLQADILDDTLKILVVLQEANYSEVFNRLQVLGNVPNRREIVLRQMLAEDCNGSNGIDSSSSATAKKRRSDQNVDNELNMKIKIRKKDGQLQVVQTIKDGNDSNKVSSPSTVPFRPSEHNSRIRSPTSSSSSSTSAPTSSASSSTSVSNPSTRSNSPDDLPIFGQQMATPLGDYYGNDYVDEPAADAINTTSKVVKKSSIPVPVNAPSVATASKKKDAFSKTKKSKSAISQSNYVQETETALPHNNQQYTSVSSSAEPKMKDVDLRNNNAAEAKFNLIEYIAEVTLAPQKKIKSYCQVMDLDVNKMPNDEELNVLISSMLPTTEVIHVDSDDNVNTDDFDRSSSDTEEYDQNAIKRNYKMGWRDWAWRKAQELSSPDGSNPPTPKDADDDMELETERLPGTVTVTKNHGATVVRREEANKGASNNQIDLPEDLTAARSLTHGVAMADSVQQDAAVANQPRLDNWAANWAEQILAANNAYEEETKQEVRPTNAPLALAVPYEPTPPHHNLEKNENRRITPVNHGYDMAVAGPSKQNLPTLLDAITNEMLLPLGPPVQNLGETGPSNEISSVAGPQIPNLPVPGPSEHDLAGTSKQGSAPSLLDLAEAGPSKTPSVLNVWEAVPSTARSVPDLAQAGPSKQYLAPPVRDLAEAGPSKATSVLNVWEAVPSTARSVPDLAPQAGPSKQYLAPPVRDLAEARPSKRPPVVNLAEAFMPDFAGPSEQKSPTKFTQKRPLNLAVMGAGSSVEPKNMKSVDEKLVLKLIEMFPEACPDYIRSLSENKTWHDFDSIVTVIFSVEDYPRRPERVPSPDKEVDPEEQFDILKELMPDADPSYLQRKCEEFAGNSEGLKAFINNAMEHKDYPTMKEYLRKQQLSAQLRQYTTEFNVENFIKIFPDPKAVFEDPKRDTKMDIESTRYVFVFLRNRYESIPIKTIQEAYAKHKNKLWPTVNELNDINKKGNLMKSKRKPAAMPDNLQNIPLLQDLAYIQHKFEIETYLVEKKVKEERERSEAKKNGLMEMCNCCYDEEIMPKDAFMCAAGCRFCRDCIKRSTEVAFGDGKLDFPCLANCGAEFMLQTLQKVLPPKMFSKIAQKKALDEIKVAGIEELEVCPFCDFASIPAPGDRLFHCLNPDCMKESCRACKEPSHVPLRCDELEKDEAVKARTYIEDKMTEALLRKCWKCDKKFFKEEGCNKMTCFCGAMMCYICSQPVKDYKHFNGIGGDKHELCPLYSDNVAVNAQNVMKAAQEAKTEIDPSKLKIDPTADIEKHYDERKKKAPREPHLELINRPLHLHRVMAHEEGERRAIQLAQQVQRQGIQAGINQAGRRRARHALQAAYLAQQVQQRRNPAQGQEEGRLLEMLQDYRQQLLDLDNRIGNN